jgi:hypothetical protein
MSQNVPTPQIYGTLLELARELKDFADTSGLKAAFDIEGNAYIEGNGFVEQLQKENLVRNNELRAVNTRHYCQALPKSATEL